jgi:hypothetical protein
VKCFKKLSEIHSSTLTKSTVFVEVNIFSVLILGHSSRIVGQPEVIQKRASRRSMTMSSKPTSGLRQTRRKRCSKEREQAGFLLALRAIALGQESVAALLGLGERGGVFR